MTSEKRRGIRKSLKYPAQIDIGGGAPPCDCMLSNASEDGAQLEVADGGTLPDEFTLILGYDGTALRRCRVRWRADPLIGVQFLKPPRSPTDTDGGEPAAAEAPDKEPTPSV